MKTFALMVTCILYMLLSFGTTACQKKMAVNTMDTFVAPAANQKRYLALGDSYTIGQSVAANERFPAQVTVQLRNAGIDLADPQYIARTGWTTINLQDAINTQNPQGPYDVVSLLIGVNDQYQTHDTSNYRNNFTLLLNKAITLAGNKKEKVFVVSIPDYSVTPFAASYDRAQISKEIDWFNAINKSVVMNYGISYTDITPGSRDGANNASLIASDGLHPSGLEYKKWADLLFVKMREVLK